MRWSPADLCARLTEAMTVYADAMGYSRSVIDSRAGYTAAHTRREGFRAAAALDADDAVVGFGYGYTTEPGQWWHDQVRRALAPELAEPWLPDAFELCELHVTPAHQSHGIGRTLLYALCEDLPHRSVLLSTPEGDTFAFGLYRSSGFEDLVRHYLFSGDSRRFAILGARLPLQTPPPAGD